MMTKKTKSKDTERDYQRLVEQETLIFEATEMIAELLEADEVSRKELADKLGRSKGFVTQILSGDRNMTLRTLADFAYAMERRVRVAAAPLIESGDGGEAAEEPTRAKARVYAGAGDCLTRSDNQQGDNPRRQLAAEGAGAGFYAIDKLRTTTYFNAHAGDERAERLLLWESPDAAEPVAG
jgi:transcriptional regulator with XRE-family HTH domain